MKSVTKLTLAALAASLISAAAAMADSTVTRIDHTNGQPTFIYTPQCNGPVATIGVYENGRSFRAVSQSDAVVSRVDHSNGTPTFIYTPQMNGPVGTR